MDKLLYYVTLETREIHRKPFDNQVKYYEVEATDKEILEIQALFSELDDTEHDPDPFMLSLKRPYDDDRGQELRNTHQDILDKIMVSIYELGTAKTKEEIQTMNGTNQRT